VKSVVDGVKDILIDMVRTNKFVLEWCERVSKGKDNYIECTKSKSKQETDDKKEKFDQYFDFKRNVGSLKHFQVMAINRGENLKALSVKIKIAHHAENAIKRECIKVLSRVHDNNLKRDTVEDACSRLILPMVCRRVRSWLTEAAVESSIDVFADNLKHLLLTRPVKGIHIMAIDPGGNVDTYYLKRFQIMSH
jgi:transcriptional accessory protein Tex/SPT6